MILTPASRIVGFVPTSPDHAFTRVPVVVTTQGETIRADQWRDNTVDGPAVTDFTPLPEPIPVRPCVAWVLTHEMDDNTQFSRTHLEKNMNRARKPIHAITMPNRDRVLLVEDPYLVAFRARWANRMIDVVEKIRHADPGRALRFATIAHRVAPKKEKDRANNILQTFKS